MVPPSCLGLGIGTELGVTELLQNLQEEIDAKYFTVACRISKHIVQSLIASILGFEAGHPMGWAPPHLSLCFLSVDTM